MKKFLAIAMIAATLTSCGGGETKEEATTDTAATVAPMETPAPVDTAAAAPVDTTAKVAADTTKAAH
jgi:PBP1b-binding outer membrane lipoprotein LpoB